MPVPFADMKRVSDRLITDSDSSVVALASYVGILLRRLAELGDEEAIAALDPGQPPGYTEEQPYGPSRR